LRACDEIAGGLEPSRVIGLGNYAFGIEAICCLKVSELEIVIEIVL
jgi:hypothetical protein